MKKMGIILMACVLVPCIFSACVYSNVNLPMQAMLATENVGTAKVGTASVTVILGLVAWGDGSVKAAMDQGGISKVHHVDNQTYNVLGVYTKYTVKVYGE